MRRVAQRPEESHQLMRIRDYLFFSLRMLMMSVRNLSLVAAFLVGTLLGLTFSNWHRTSETNVPVYNDNQLRFNTWKKLSLPINRVEITTQQYQQYLQSYQTQIDGWFSREILYVIWIITRYQYDHVHIAGAIGEIGVHHGKFTCFLYLMRRYREQTLFAIDVFDNQALNKDQSGAGRKDLFLNNVRTFADVHRNELATYAGSSLDLNPVFSTDLQQSVWWNDNVVGERGIQLISVDGGHTGLLTYSDLCIASNAMIDGGVVVVDDITHPGWLGVRDGTSRFLAETSALLTDSRLENEMAIRPASSNFELSKRIVNATNLPRSERRSPCSRLVPFLQYYNKLFLTTPNYYPYYIDLLAAQEHFANEARARGVIYLEYHALRLTIGNVPVWTENHELNETYRADLFKTLIEPVWKRQIETANQRAVK